MFLGFRDNIIASTGQDRTTPNNFIKLKTGKKSKRVDCRAILTLKSSKLVVFLFTKAPPHVPDNGV